MRWDPAVFVEVPWLDSRAIRDPVVWRPYGNYEREVPDGIPGDALTSYEWRKRIVIYTGELIAPVKIWSVEK